MNNQSEIVQSLEELMHRAFSLSLRIVYETISPGGGYLHPRKIMPFSDELVDNVYGWADGLSHGYYERMSSGRCSMKSFVEFSVESFESSVKRDIAMMVDMLSVLHEPRQLTCDEMWMMGYRGKWAGEFKQLTFPNA